MQEHEGSRAEFLRQLVEQGEEPAFIARARHLEMTIEGVHEACQAQRRELLKMPQMHLAALKERIVAHWDRLSDELADDASVDILLQLSEEWKDAGTYIPAALQWFSCPRTLLERLVDSLNRFNKKWEAYVASIDLAEVNRVIDDYNRFFPIEKGAAFGRADFEHLGFEPVDPISQQQLFDRYPSVRVPTLS